MIFYCNASKVFYCVRLLIEVHSYGLPEKLCLMLFVIVVSKSKTDGCFTNINSVGALSTK